MQSTIRSIFITTLLFCLNTFMTPVAFAAGIDVVVDGVSFSIAEREGFLRTSPIQPDIILNAGELGYYRFTDDQNRLTAADLIKIRPELRDLIHALRQERGNGFQIIDGLRTPQHNIYRWAAWLNEHPRQLKMLNARGYQSWAEWIAASQTIPGSVSLQSKHQTGDAAEVTWEGLNTTTERHRDMIADYITELGGKSEGTPLFKTIAVENDGKPAFRIVYQPSEAPPLPALDQIGTRFTAPYLDVNAVSQKPDEGTPTIHALLFSDPRDMPITKNIDEMAGFLLDLKESLKCTLNLDVWAADAAPIDSKRLLAWIDTLQTQDDDIVFVYYTGHGGADPETRELYLTLSGDTHLPRKQVAEALKALPCRLKILLTDSGSFGPMVTETPEDTSSDAIHHRGTTPTPSLWPATFRHLFLQHEGFLNLTAATEGEHAYAIEEAAFYEGFLSLTAATEGEHAYAIEEAAFFTTAFLSAIRGYADENADGFVSWEEVFHVTRSGTISTGTAFLEDKTQRPKYYGELPKRTTPNTKKSAPLFDSEHIVYIKGGAEGETSSYAYLAQLIDPSAEPAETVAVYIFNEELRKKLGDTIPAAFILAERTMPKDGWGTSQVMLSFYRNDAWIHTLEATVFEDYYLLPERLKNEPLQGPRKVGLGEVRVTIPVTYEHD